MIDFDHVITELGGTGRYQVVLVLMLLYWTIPSGYNLVAPVFVSYIPDYRCEVSEIANCTAGMNENEILNLTTPIKPNGKYDRCERYQYQNNSTCTNTCDCIDYESDVIPCDEGYHYDTSLFTKTVVTEFDLVCDRAYLHSLSSSVFMIGRLVGCLTFGYVSDRYGRKVSMTISTIFTLVVLIVNVFVPNFWLYLMCRFAVAMFDVGIYIAAFVYAMEIVTDKWRTWTGILFQIGFAIGYMLLSGFAYHWHHWREMQLVMSVFFLPTFLFLFLIPESPRWLFAKGCDVKGKKISRGIAERNKIQINETTIWKHKEEICFSPDIREEAEDKTYSTIDLFRKPGIRFVTCFMTIVWFVCGFVYYGVTLNVGSLSGDIFINNTLGGLVDIVANIVVAIFMDRTGRRSMLIFMLSLAGIGLISSTVVTEFAGSNQSLQTLSVVLALAAKLGSSGAFGVISNFTTELYPTVMRVNAMAIGSISSVIAGAVAPFVLTLQTSISWLPNVLFGVTSLFATLLSICLPETKDEHLLESIEAAEEFYAKNRFLFKSDSKIIPSEPSVFTIFTNERTDDAAANTRL